jgi:hypothetical protein
MSAILLQPLIWYLCKAEQVTSCWLSEHTMAPSKIQSSPAIQSILN